MKILVTGHEGFIGRNLSGYLASKGHEITGYEFIPNTLPDVEEYDWVVHLGAISSTRERVVDKVLEQNFEFSMRLLNLCEMQETNFQYASSASVYGSLTDFREDAPVSPQSPYAWSKYLFDRAIRTGGDFNIKVQGFRYFNVYGNFEDQKGDQASPVHKFTKQAKEKGRIQIFDGSEKFHRDFVCVEDICQLHEKFFNVEESGLWNVGTGETHSFKEVANAIAKKHNADIIEIPMPEDLISQYQKYTCANLTRLNKHVNMNWINVIDWINR
jgi:ADP-L-glycero-D-manno-heptose 6-epimerase